MTFTEQLLEHLAAIVDEAAEKHLPSKTDRHYYDLALPGHYALKSLANVIRMRKNKMSDDKQEVSFSEASKKLSAMAQLTAVHSKNWDNFSDILESELRRAYEAGKAERSARG